MRLLWIFLGLSFLVLTGCEKIVLLSTPSKKAMVSRSQTATYAKYNFIQTLHDGRYEDIPRANYFLMAAYLENPYDPKLAAYLGFLHIWAITERARKVSKSPLEPNHIVL